MTKIRYLSPGDADADLSLLLADASKVLSDEGTRSDLLTRIQQELKSSLDSRASSFTISKSFSSHVLFLMRE